MDLAAAVDSGNVSIHALLAECDDLVSTCIPEHAGFNPRTPCGVRRLPLPSSGRKSLFQSTHSLRSATFQAVGIDAQILGFNPRTPCGVRPMKS